MKTGLVVVSVPPYLKPYSKVVSWTVPMAYLVDEKTEYIAEGVEISVVYTNQIPAYRNYYKLVLSKDLRGLAERFKVSVEADSKFYMPVPEFVEVVTDGKVIGEADLNLNLLNETAYKELDKIYEMLDRDLRHVIALPMQWLVYIPSKGILSRLCWAIEVKGRVKVRPYGTRGLLLEVNEAKVEDVSNPSLKRIKRRTVVKQRINDYWRKLVSTELVGEELEGLESLMVGGEEEVEEKVGEVE